MKKLYRLEVFYAEEKEIEKIVPSFVDRYVCEPISVDYLHIRILYVYLTEEEVLVIRLTLPLAGIHELELVSNKYVIKRTI